MGLEKYEEMYRMVLEAKANHEEWERGIWVRGRTARRMLRELIGLAREVRVELQCEWNARMEREGKGAR